MADAVYSFRLTDFFPGSFIVGQTNRVQALDLARFLERSNGLPLNPNFTYSFIVDLTRIGIVGTDWALSLIINNSSRTQSSYQFNNKVNALRIELDLPTGNTSNPIETVTYRFTQSQVIRTPFGLTFSSDEYDSRINDAENVPLRLIIEEVRSKIAGIGSTPLAFAAAANALRRQPVPFSGKSEAAVEFTSLAFTFVQPPNVVFSGDDQITASFTAQPPTIETTLSGSDTVAVSFTTRPITLVQPPDVVFSGDDQITASFTAVPLVIEQQIVGTHTTAAEFRVRRLRFVSPPDVVFSGDDQITASFSAQPPTIETTLSGTDAVAVSFITRQLAIVPPPDIDVSGDAQIAASFAAQPPFVVGSLKITGRDQIDSRFLAQPPQVSKPPATPVPPTLLGDQQYVGWIVDIAGIGLMSTPYRVWSGEGQLTIGGQTYEGTSFGGGALASISPVEQSLDAPTSRASVTIAVPNAAVREMLEIDIGPVTVNLRYIYSSDFGKTWTIVPIGIQGRLSRPSYEVDGSLYTVEIETWSGDSDRGNPKLWSHETQQSEHPGDRGFEFARALAEGIESRWPP